jgi:hypothetical protein
LGGAAPRAPRACDDAGDTVSSGGSTVINAKNTLVFVVFFVLSIAT